jgi:hypothetical protein
MRVFTLFILMTGCAIVAAGIAPFSVWYLQKDSADLKQNPAADSPVFEQCPRIFYGEKLTAIKDDGDWLQVLVAGGWSGWIKYRDAGKEYIAAENMFRKNKLTYAEALQKARDTAHGWAADATPIMAYALQVLPSGLAETWNIAFWSGARKGYLVVEQSKSVNRRMEYKTFPDVAGFDPYAYDHKGWAKPLLENVLDSDAVMESAWTRLRGEREKICTLTIYRGPNPIPADAERRTGFIPPWGEDIWYVRVNHTDQSYQVLLLDLNGTWKGTAAFAN